MNAKYNQLYTDGILLKQDDLHIKNTAYFVLKYAQINMESDSVEYTRSVLLALRDNDYDHVFYMIQNSPLIKKAYILSLISDRQQIYPAKEYTRENIIEDFLTTPYCAIHHFLKNDADKLYYALKSDKDKQKDKQQAVAEKIIRSVIEMIQTRYCLFMDEEIESPQGNRVENLQILTEDKTFLPYIRFASEEVRNKLLAELGCVSTFYQFEVLKMLSYLILDNTERLEWLYNKFKMYCDTEEFFYARSLIREINNIDADFLHKKLTSDNTFRQHIISTLPEQTLIYYCNFGLVHDEIIFKHAIDNKLLSLLDVLGDGPMKVGVSNFTCFKN